MYQPEADPPCLPVTLPLAGDSARGVSRQATAGNVKLYILDFQI